MITWERGSGITQACGTGASAVCVAGRLTHRTDELIRAELPGESSSCLGMGMVPFSCPVLRKKFWGVLGGFDSRPVGSQVG